jgi:hypothetical protein
MLDQNPSDAGDDIEPLAVLIERASLAIGRLDAHVSVSSATKAWSLRAAWTGYARALQLAGTEIDEIDVFSWGSGVSVPHRPRRHTLNDSFASFAPWRDRLVADGRHWAEDLPFSPAPDRSGAPVPMVIRALALQADYVKAERSIDAWLSLPIFLHRHGLTERPLPCLVEGDRRLLFDPRDLGPSRRRTLRGLEAAALKGRKALIGIEDGHVLAMSALANEVRPTALKRLVALLMQAPVQSPESVARQLKLTLSGAGKLLSRAASLGLILEVSGRRAWRTYVVPDLAIALSFIAPPKGRPRSRPALDIPRADIHSVLQDFDREMADFDARFSFDRGT